MLLLLQDTTAHWKCAGHLVHCASASSAEQFPKLHGIVRTTLELDDVLVASLMARLSGVSKTEAIQRAVRFYLTHDAVDQLRQLAGTVEIEDISRRLRATDRKT